MAPHNPCMQSKWTSRVHTDYHVRQDTPHLCLLVCPALFLLLIALPSTFQQCRNPSYCEHSFTVNSPSPFFHQEHLICFCAINLSVPGPIINPNSHCYLLCETMVGPLNLIPLPLGLMLRRECSKQWRRKGFVMVLTCSFNRLCSRGSFSNTRWPAASLSSPHPPVILWWNAPGKTAVHEQFPLMP